jgi:hypothetical protein
MGTGVLHAQEYSGDRNCSNASVAGSWGYTETGTVLPEGVATPFDAVARYTLDAGGKMSGKATSSSGGNVSNVTLAGWQAMNSDCTGTLTVGVFQSGVLLRTVIFTMVYGGNGRAARGLVTSLVLANGTNVPAVLTIDAKRLFY